MDIYEQITKMADEIAPELVAQRRDFHKFAEKGWFEMRTSSIIARKLTEMGYEVSVGDQVCKKDARMGVPSDALPGLWAGAAYTWPWRPSGPDVCLFCPAPCF